MSDIEKLLDNAACCSQDRGMLDDGVLRKCVRLNVAEPLTKEIERLTHEVKELRAALRNIGCWYFECPAEIADYVPNTDYEQHKETMKEILLKPWNRDSGRQEPDIKMTYSEKDGLNIDDGRQEQNDA